MLNYQENIITQRVAVFFVWILLLTSAALRGYAPDDARACKDCAVLTHSTNGCCDNATDCNQQSDNDDVQQHDKCHCYCFSDLQSILTKSDIQNSLLQQPFFYLEFQITDPQFTQNLFRPPKSR